MSSEAKKKMVLARAKQETVAGDVICTASGRATKCEHKVNLMHHTLKVPLVVCAIGASKQVCVKAGSVV